MGARVGPVPDRIALRGLTARGRHGWFAHERENGQEFTVDVVLGVDTRTAAASDDLAPQVVETIQQVASPSAIGDGKIFVLDLAQAVRIRTGEAGDTAL